MAIAAALSLLACVSAALARPYDSTSVHARAYTPNPAWSGKTTVVQTGKTGVAAMQITVVDQNSILIIDKAEKNPLQVNGKSVWIQWLNVKTGASKGIYTQSNSFCGAGAYMSNGTLVSIGGDVGIGLGDKNGHQALRFFNKCSDSGCSLGEWPTRVHMQLPRWYPTTLRTPQGDIINIGGMQSGGFNDYDLSASDMTFEYWPPRGVPLQDARPSNLFPVAYVIGPTQIFMAANKLAMIYDSASNSERRLPSLPSRINYPWTAASGMLALRPSNSYTATMVFCGGSNQNDGVDPSQLSSYAPTISACYRMDLTENGIGGGWQNEDALPTQRVMGEMVQLSDGSFLIVNGAANGVAGYGDVPDRSGIGASNARNPVLQPVRYDPDAPVGSRMSINGIAATTVPRLYHSSATLLPDGRVMIMGSNPRDGVSTSKYPTEYRIEYLSPPYLSMPRPTFSSLPSKLNHGATMQLAVTLPSGTTVSQVTVSLMDLGFNTHGVHMNQRLVELVASLSSDGKTLTVTGPPNAGIYPPGPGFIFVLANGVPSVGQRLIIGTGAGPTVNAAALKAAQGSQVQIAGARQGSPTAAAAAPEPTVYVEPDDNTNESGRRPS